MYNVYNVIRWYRSKDKKQTPDSDFTSYMVNKKWWLEEKFNVHIMRFQQVKISLNSYNLTYLLF